MARAAKKKDTKQVSMEEALWDAADEMRGSVEYPVYKQVVLGLVFLKFVSDRFERRKQELIAEGKEKMVEQSFAYTMKNVFYLPEKARWSYLATEAAKQSDLKLQLDNAMEIIEKNNETLKGALPSNFYVTVDLDVSKLASLIDIMNGVDLSKDEEEDVIGRVYEYFLSKFSSKEGKGEFYTPKPIVKIITEMIQPLKGRIFDPCCGSGGMFVQSMKLVQAHHGNKADVSIYGQEYTLTTLNVLANGSLTSNTNGDGEIRKNLVDRQVVDCIVALPEKLFYSTGIPVCLWFCSKSKIRREDDTKDKVLFIDCRKMGRLYDRTHKTIDDDEIEKIASTYHNWLAGKGYEDVQGFCKSVPISEVAESDYMLTPGRYVGLAPEEEDSEPYEEKMKRLTSELGELFKESHRLEEEIKKNLKALGFEI